MRRRPVVVNSRRGPGLIGTIARTAVIAGTATTVSKGVSGAMNASAQQQAQQRKYQAQQEASIQQEQITAAKARLQQINPFGPIRRVFD